MSADDLLDTATEALRQTTRASASAHHQSDTLDRVLGTIRLDRRARQRRGGIILLLAVAVGGSTAWAATTGRLPVLWRAIEAVRGHVPASRRPELTSKRSEPPRSEPPPLATTHSGAVEVVPQKSVATLLAENRPTAPAENRPTAPAENRPTARADSRLISAADNRPISAAENRPISAAENRPISAAENRPISAAENRPISAAENRPISAAENRPISPAENRPISPAENRPAMRPQKRAPFSTSPLDGEALYEAAHHAHFVARNPMLALSAWERYLKDAPRGRFALEARYNRALCLVRLGRADEAIAALAEFAAGEHQGYRQTEAQALIAALRHRHRSLGKR